MKFLHTMIRVADINKSLEFYRDIIGLKVTHTIELEDCRLHFLSDKDGCAQIELTENFEPKKYTNGNAFGHFAFYVDDYEELTSKLHKAGYQYEYGPEKMSDAKGNYIGTVAFVKDPDNNEIEFLGK